MPTARVKFAIVGLAHMHAYAHVQLLRGAGAEMAAVYSDEPDRLAVFTERFPEVPVASSMDAILDDLSIGVIAGSPMPADRAKISIQAMLRGKDVLTDKPAVLSPAELDEIERVQGQTRRIWCLFSNEHHDRRCTVLAGTLVAEGSIGRVVQTTGLGPHLLRPEIRPKWFFNPALSGGIIGDIGTHQIEQFLAFTGSREAEITLAQTGNFANSDLPGFEDYGEVALRGDGGTGWFRVDWYTPECLGMPGDVRLMVLGTDGYIETRKYVDPAGRKGGEHVLIVNKDGARYLDTSAVVLPFGTRFLNDVRNRTETAIPQARSFLVARLAAMAQQRAKSLRLKPTQSLRQGNP